MIVEILEEIEDFFDEVDLYSTKVRAGILTMDEALEEYLILERAAVLTYLKGEKHILVHVYEMERDSVMRYAEEEVEEVSERIDEWSDRVITEMLEEIEETRSFKGKRGVYNPSAVAGNIWRD